MKIMIVDESAAERKLCRRLLEEAHTPQLEFVEAATAVAGLETAQAVKLDCILLEYQLPDMNGLEFLARLNRDQGVAPAVVMLTGVTTEQVVVEALKAGAQDYLIKDRITSGSLDIAIKNATHKVSLMRALQADRDRLAQSLAEKDVLLQELHHRVKNNLQVVASLLRLQAEDGQAAADALRESQLRVETMALIHEQLYQSGDLRRVSVVEHAGLLMNNLLSVYGVDRSRISGEVVMEPLALGVDQAIPAGLILNELMSNALKHAFPAGRHGRIVVAGGLSNGRAEMTVWNNGVELPEEFDLQKGTSLGLRIVQILARQLKGTLDIDRNGGTAFRISFPGDEHASV
jgi:two-component sensor histidine kinase